MAVIGTMAVATQTAHRDKGPFVADGGPELTLTNIAAATTIAVVGPGRFSLDRLLRVRPSKLLIALAAMAGVGTAAAVIQTQAVHRAEADMNPVPAADMVEPDYVDVDLPVPA
jgi:putative oxidoreductase